MPRVHHVERYLRLGERLVEEYHEHAAARERLRVVHEPPHRLRLRATGTTANGTTLLNNTIGTIRESKPSRTFDSDAIPVVCSTHVCAGNRQTGSSVLKRRRHIQVQDPCSRAWADGS